MIKKVIKILTNPQGALIQAIFGMVEAFVKEFIKDNIEEKLEKTVKYMDEPNECDLKVDALQDAFISQQREIDSIKKTMLKRGK